MSNCRYCEGPVETSQRTGKPKLYCGKKCANAWHHHQSAKRYIKKNEDWGTRGERDRREKLARAKIREEKNAWIDEYCVSRAQMALDLGIHETTLWNRMKALGLKSHKKTIRGEKNTKTFTFIEKAHIEAIKNYKGKSYKAETPLGYMSKAEASKEFGVLEQSLMCKLSKIKEKTGSYPVRRRYVAEVVAGRTGMRCFYNIEDIKNVKETEFLVKNTCKSCGSEFESKRKAKYCKPGCKNTIKMAKRAALVGRLGVISHKEAMKEVGCSQSWSGLVESVVKIGSGRYIKKDLIPVLQQKYNRYLALKAKDRKDPVIRREDDWQHWQSREEKLLAGFPAKVKRWEKKLGAKSRRVDDLLNAIDINHSYHGIMEVTGEVTHLSCKTCNNELPFYEYYFSARGGASGRNLSACRQCRQKVSKKKYDPSRAKSKRQENHAGRLRIQVATSIKRHITKITGTYSSLSTSLIWDAIENKLGYTHDALVQYLESQFTESMHWKNQTTPRNPGEFGWHLDHIVPHSGFKYDSLDHPDFIPCWALENLRPLEAVMNMQKGSKSLYQSYSSSYRFGLKKAIKGSLYTKGVWRYLDYDNLEAKKNIEKKFATFSGLNWSNWGDIWQVDHIDPVAHLAFTTPESENFKKCWSLSNLSPIPRALNASKGSRWEDKLWFHNY